jgi:outer membrane immunogenic protein
LAFSGLLAYATGGAAITDLQTSHSYADATGNDVSGRWSHSQVKLGWTVGGGVEWGVNRNWRVKAEYLYVKFGSINAAGQIGGPSPFSIAYAEAISTSADLTAHIARAGVNFRF